MENEYQYFCKPGQTLEEAVKERTMPYIGRSTESLRMEFDINKNCKSVNSNIARAILGVSSSNMSPYKDMIEQKTRVKTVRLEADGKNKESITLSTIKYMSIVHEEWNESALYEMLTSPWIFFVMIHNPDEPIGESEYIIDKAFVWRMPDKDIEIAHKVWSDTKEKIASGDYNHFISAKNKMIIHVRPHGRDSYDLLPTPQMTMEKKKGFWLNKDYVFTDIISKPIEYHFDNAFEYAAEKNS